MYHFIFKINVYILVWHSKFYRLIIEMVVLQYICYLYIHQIVEICILCHVYDWYSYEKCDFLPVTHSVWDLSVPIPFGHIRHLMSYDAYDIKIWHQSIRPFLVSKEAYGPHQSHLLIQIFHGGLQSKYECFLRNGKFLKISSKSQWIFYVFVLYLNKIYRKVDW